ncbi:LpqB family beta-propeller domain-containing protein [Georgenia yuyongxinii]|uniref:GerMN domain-containing protein n=1 Tax=Georgenia yuyongxinii TaxID=2589797 RepID=A0A552WN55_9MICO|nr:LpqB family beta-propeller domain-containing protein [Georgenia yuyongxinii]TRW44134.1 hypothetical protein FJ693_14745 [Georgenia yuyongxinii]
MTAAADSHHARRPGPRRRPAAVLVVVVAALLVLAGCASLPRSGPVTASDPDLPAAQGIGLFARGPEVGASPQEIVDGFLAASAAGYSDDFLVARQFLAGTAEQTWQPLAQVRIFADAQPQYTRTRDGAVRLSVASQATVDSDGRFTESGPQAAIETEFTLVRDTDGEWRIIELDDGVLVPFAIFSSVYVQSALYFVTPDRQAFVPEVRWFPRENLATALVRGLLQGPSPWLSPGVVNMAPTGTRMTVESVAVTDGVAQVNLSAESLAAEPEERALFAAQLTRTLREVPGVQEVQLTAASAPYEITDDVPELPAYPYSSRNPVVVADGALAEVDGGEVVPRPGADQLAGLDPRHPAVGYEQQNPTTVFLDGADRLMAAAGADAPVELVTGAGLVPPSVDLRGWVWTTPAGNEGTLVAVRPDRTRVGVAAPWLDGGTVVSLRISREGARAVVVWQAAGSTVIDAAAVVRDVDGTPRALADPVRIGDRVTAAADLAWVDENTVAVLGDSGGDSEPTVHLLPLGGPTSRLPVVEGAVSIAAGRGERSILLGTGDGRLYERTGAAWRAVHDDVFDPALPG